MDRDKLRADLIRDEGWKAEAYQDTRKLWTIGVGHLLGEVRRMDFLLDFEVEALLNYDTDTAVTTARAYLPTFDHLDEVRQRALANMAFNLGNRIKNFVKLGAALAVGDWVRAAAEMQASRWAEQVGDRAKRLQHMILTGTDPA